MTAGVSPITVLQLTDLHLFSDPEQDLLGLNTRWSLDLIIQAIKALSHQPDVILLTGDLAQDESAGAYQALQQKFSGFSVPVYPLPGNHDNPALMAAILSQPPFKSSRLLSLGGWRFVLLDSSVAGQVRGALSAETLSQLDTTLAASSEPTAIALHHPAYPVQSDWLDDSLENYQDFWALLDRHPHVKVVLSGHVHQAMTFTRRGVQYLSTPSTCAQFKPRSRTFAVDDRDPGFRLLTLYPDGTFLSWVERVPVKQQVNLQSRGY